MKIEKNKENICGATFSIVFDEWTDLELINEYKEAITDAIKCIASNDETLNTYGNSCYALANLLEQMEYNIDDQSDMILCKQMNETRLRTLREMPYKISQNKEMKKEEQEMKKLLFD